MKKYILLLFLILCINSSFAQKEPYESLIKESAPTLSKALEKPHLISAVTFDGTIEKDKIPQLIKLKILEEITIKNIDLFPIEICQLKKLKVINIDGKIKILPKEIMNLIHLKELRIKGELQELTPSIYELFNLEILEIEGGHLKIDSKIVNLQKLTAIILYNNDIKDLPKEIGELKSLQFLDINNNPITTLPVTLKNITSNKPINGIEKMIYISNSKISLEEKKRLKKEIGIISIN